MSLAHLFVRRLEFLCLQKKTPPAPRPQCLSRGPLSPDPAGPLGESPSGGVSRTHEKKLCRPSPRSGPPYQLSDPPRPQRLQDTSQIPAAGMDPKEPCRHDVNSICAGSKEQWLQLVALTSLGTSVQNRAEDPRVNCQSRAGLRSSDGLWLGSPFPFLLRPSVHLCRWASWSFWQDSWESALQPPTSLYADVRVHSFQPRPDCQHWPCCSEVTTPPHTQNLLAGPSIQQALYTALGGTQANNTHSTN